MPAQPTNPSQNTGLVIIIVGIFMVIIAFLAVTYLSSDTIKTNQDKNAERSREDRSNLTKITCALWESVGDPGKVSGEVQQTVREACEDAS